MPDTDPRADDAGPGLMVAVTGPTGTFGAGLVPLLHGPTQLAARAVSRLPLLPPSFHWWRRSAIRW